MPSLFLAVVCASKEINTFCFNCFQPLVRVAKGQAALPTFRWNHASSLSPFSICPSLCLFVPPSPSPSPSPPPLQDDAHIFCEEGQIGEEVKGVLDFLQRVYGIFGFTFDLELSTVGGVGARGREGRSTSAGVVCCQTACRHHRTWHEPMLAP